MLSPTEVLAKILKSFAEPIFTSLATLVIALLSVTATARLTPILKLVSHSCCWTWPLVSLAWSTLGDFLNRGIMSITLWTPPLVTGKLINQSVPLGSTPIEESVVMERLFKRFCESSFTMPPCKEVFALTLAFPLLTPTLMAVANEVSFFSAITALLLRVFTLAAVATKPPVAVILAVSLAVVSLEPKLITASVSCTLITMDAA